MDTHFPKGLRVLAVDDDATCLRLACRMLQYCKYTVTSCTKPTDALSLLREQKESFDLVITDVQMPEMDGFKLLEQIVLELNIPVIMMSAHDEEETMMKGLTHGACFYLVKPIKIDQIKSIWQYAIRKNQVKDVSEQVGSVDNGSGRYAKKNIQEREMYKVAPKKDEECANSGTQGEWKTSNNNGGVISKRQRRRTKDVVTTIVASVGGSSKNNITPPMQRKPRVLWNNQLHNQFINAVNRIGIERAVPKKILEIMRTPGLSRENVASHLQKYRLYLKKVKESGMNGMDGAKSSSRIPTKSIFGSIPSQVMIHSMQQQQQQQHSSLASRFISQSLPGQFGIQRYSATPTNNQMLLNSHHNFSSNLNIDEMQFPSSQYRYSIVDSSRPQMIMSDNMNQLRAPQQQFQGLLTNHEVTMNGVNQIIRPQPQPQPQLLSPNSGLGLLMENAQGLIQLQSCDNNTHIRNEGMMDSQLPDFSDLPNFEDLGVEGDDLTEQQRVGRARSIDNELFDIVGRFIQYPEEENNLEDIFLSQPDGTN